MKKAILINSALILTGLLTSTANQAQTCKLADIRATTQTAQFEENRNGTVTDRTTGLIWKKCSEGLIWNKQRNTCTGSPQTYTWKTAFEQVATVNTGSDDSLGFTDWRLPNIKELASIVERNCQNPAINNIVFPQHVVANYWTSSQGLKLSEEQHSTKSWVVNFDTGSNGMITKDTDSYLHLVRDK